MSIKALQDYTFNAKYARYNPTLKRRESWAEATNRVMQMHLQRYPQVEEEIRWAFEQVKEKRVLGSQRTLQYGGEPILRKHARGFNCTVSYCDRIRFFQEALWLLLCGCGVGFSVQKHHIAKLPDFLPAMRHTRPNRIFIIPDSIEGWADALGVLLATYFPHGEFSQWAESEVVFDFSQIRSKGSPLSSGAGKAPGPEPLKKALESIRALLSHCAASKSRLRTIDAYDLVMHASDAVLSGGVRRSASICVFSPDDELMIKAKTGDWFYTNPQRGRSNNSALLLRSTTTREQFHNFMDSVKQFGEPGFIWADSTEMLFNPCVTQNTWVHTTEGPQKVKDLIGKKFVALVDGDSFASTDKGFFPTGMKEVYSLRTTKAYTLEATQNHKILTLEHLTHKSRRTTWKEVKDLVPGDMLILNNHRNSNFNGKGSFDEGWLLGNLKGDGHIKSRDRGGANLVYWGVNQEPMLALATSRIQATVGSHRPELGTGRISKQDRSIVGSARLKKLTNVFGFNGVDKIIGDAVECTSFDFHQGFIRGWFDADGSVQGDHKKGVSVRLASVDFAGLQVVQRMLLRLGIVSTIYSTRHPATSRSLPDGKGEEAEYKCQALHELCVANDNLMEFALIIGFDDPDKQNTLVSLLQNYKRALNHEPFCAELEKIELIGEQEVFDCTIPGISAFDANGLYVHNCTEAGMYPVDVTTGLSGWQQCNLCEINGKKCHTSEDFATAAKAAAIIGTLQAGYTKFEYLGEVSERISRREALLGVSITGMMDNPDILFDPKLQQVTAELVVRTNTWMAKKIGINPCARGTCVKPAGTTSCILGTSSGIHAHHSHRYIRRVQANELEAPYQFYKLHNPRAVEKSAWSKNETDSVVSFCIEAYEKARTKNEVDAITLLQHVRLTQQNWVAGGKVLDRCTAPWLQHSVSNTINVRPGEWDTVEEFIYKFREEFAGVALLSHTGDLDYRQAPFVAIHTPIEIAQEYGDGSLMASGLIVDGLHTFKDDLWQACDAVLGLTDSKKRFSDEEQDWIRRGKQFAERYFGGDLKRMTYCLKEVTNWKYWCDLRRENVPVDYSQLLEEEDNTTIQEHMGCAGGMCELGMIPARPVGLLLLLRLSIEEVTESWKLISTLKSHVLMEK